MKRTPFALWYLVFVSSFFSVTAYAFEFQGNPCIPDEIIVKFKQGVTGERKKALVREHGAVLKQASYRSAFTVVEIPHGTVGEKVSAFTKNPDVLYAEPNYILSASQVPDDEYYSYQWNFPAINVDRAWDVSTGNDVIVAVLDSGVNTTGWDGFGNRVLDGYNAFFQIEFWWEDGNSHGTHVAGTIGQATNNGIGVAGIAYDASILPVKVLNRFGFGSVVSVAWGIMWAADYPADIINMSLGGTQENSQTLKEAVEYAYSQGVTLVAASGNAELETVDYPAAYKQVIAVGAVDENGEHASYSNAGKALDVVAPGNGILQEAFLEWLGFPTFAIGWDYYFGNGTSMACPHVAGVAALMKAAHPEWGPEEIRTALITTAVDIAPAGKDDATGYGLIDAYAAITYK